MLLVIYILAVADQLPRFGKRELTFLQAFTCNYVVSVRRGFLFLLVLGMGCVNFLWPSLDLPNNYCNTLIFLFIGYFDLSDCYQ